ncbi:hypothetical protein ACFPRL_29970 [Pseudoclavibacter helvolus]
MPRRRWARRCRWCTTRNRQLARYWHASPASECSSRISTIRRSRRSGSTRLHACSSLAEACPN